VFGQATYGVTDKLFLTAGLRYDHVYKDMEGDASNAGHPGVLGVFGLNATDKAEGDKTFTAILPKAVVEYRFTPDVNVYASVTRGYKPGGFMTANVVQAEKSFDSEFTWSYELGSKSSLLDNRLDLNCALFYISMKDQQLIKLIPGGSVVDNAGNSHSQGLEVEAKFRITKGWDLFGALTLMEARIDDAGESSATSDNNKTPFSPDSKVNFGVQYTVHDGMFEGVFARVENTYVDSYFVDLENNTLQNPVNMLSGKVGYEHGDYGIYVYGKNLLNEEIVSTAFDNSAMMPGQTRVGPMLAPRSFGVMGKVTF